MSKKACKNCKKIYEGDKCPECASHESVVDFKGKVIIFDPENSEVAKNLKITKKGDYAIKVR
ncbi:hypothetical protein COU61_01170 [Candidatus Pacearchaeota archaeon CG10_big_fil_rev_8_21_14_0_10_35_13]|nr:MAG: hypothetical protein COU61_01170 [Candidatus Pacearchaeota archaeon CG10_big_fil_rev_8_21_14_0_10_35_13]